MLPLPVAPSRAMSLFLWGEHSQGHGCARGNDFSQEFQRLWGCWCDPASWWLLPAAVLPRQGIALPLQDVCMVSQLLAAQAGKQSPPRGCEVAEGLLFYNGTSKKPLTSCLLQGMKGTLHPDSKKTPETAHGWRLWKGPTCKVSNICLNVITPALYKTASSTLQNSPETRRQLQQQRSPSSLAALYLFVFFLLVSLSLFA